MTERSSSQGRPDDWSRSTYGAAEQQYYDRGLTGSGPGNLAAPRSGHSAPRLPADSKGFLGTLFDFSFTSFVTTTVIKVLYVLIMIITVLGALAFTFTAFTANATFGLLVLVIGDPLYIIIVLALWRLVLEFFIVLFRIAEDIHALRERGELV